MPDAHNIAEVIAELDVIIAAAIAEPGRYCLFPAMYRHVTTRVQQRISDGFFDDGPRMYRFATRFANRYFEALALWQANAAPTRSWRVAFDASRRTDLVILQH